MEAAAMEVAAKEAEEAAARKRGAASTRMPKRALPSDGSTKKKAKSKPAGPPLPNLHPSQRALVNKANAQRESELPVLITGKDKEPGLGKTYVAGAFLRECAENEIGMLVIYVAKNAELGKDQAFSVGANVSNTPFQLSRATSLKREMEAYGKACISVTRTTLNQLFHPHGKHKENPAQLPELAVSLGITSVLLCLDEIHELYKTDKLAKAVAAMRVELHTVKIEVVGMTATPEFTVKGIRENAKTLFGCEDLPEPLTYSEEEHASLLASLKQLPSAPTDWVTKDLGSPIGDPLCMALLAELQENVVGFYMAPENGKRGEDGAKMGFRAAIASTLAKVEAQLVAGGDGGAFMTVVRPLVPVKKGGEALDAKQSILIGYQNQKAATQHMQALETNNEEECNLLNLGDGTYDKKKAAAADMLDSFRASQKITLGLTDKSQHTGHDKFSKVATTLVAVGSKWTKPQLVQFAGRVGRIGTKVEPSDLVPEKYEAFHFYSKWAEQFATFDDATGLRSVELSPAIKEAIGELPDVTMNYAIEVNCKKLVRAGGWLQVGDELALAYLNEERAEMEREDGEEDSEEGSEEGSEEDDE